MDIKVENRDIVLSDNGMPVMIEGLQQAIQQLKLNAIVEKGTFIYDRQMGLESMIEILGKENSIKVVEALLNELLISLPNVTVKVLSISNSLRIKKAVVSVSDGYTTEEAEVTLYENL